MTAQAPRNACMMRRWLKGLLAVLLPGVAALAFAAPDLGVLAERFFRVTITQNAKPLLAGAIFEDTQGRLIVKGAPLAAVIARAYGVEPHQVVDAPEWVYRSHMHDIAAEPPPAELVASDATRMLQAMLGDRFGLQMQRETRAVTMLVLDRDAERQDELAREIDCAVAAQRNAQPQAPAPSAAARLQSMRYSGCLAPQYLLPRLARQVGEPIHDATGGRTLFVGTPVRALPDAGEDALAIASAALAQSGLMLERRSVDMEVVVVMQIEYPVLDVADP